MEFRTVSSRASGSNQQSSRSRSSCEPCRERKIRCSGEHPVCSRCISAKRECRYSLQRRAGRPKTRIGPYHRRIPRVQPIQAPQTPETSLDRSLDVVHVASTTDSNPGDVRALESESFLNGSSRQTSTPPYLTDFETYLQSHAGDCPESFLSLPESFTNISELNSCACLSILYLLLNQIGTRAKLVVPNDLALLRMITDKAIDVLNCAKCPQRFSSVLQNATILGILCVCIAESYVRFVRTIESTASEALEKGSKLQLLLGNIYDPSVSINQRDPSHGSSSISVDVSADQWKKLMHQAVKSEIYGSQDSTGGSFMDFIERLEKRQVSWHTVPTAPDCPSTYQSACSSPDETPLCLTIIGAARKVLKQVSPLLE